MNGLHPAMRFLTALALSAAVAMVGSTRVLAQEHPEHPTEEKSDTTEHAEHPEHPAKGFKVDMATIAEAISGYVETDTKLKGGFFFVYDPTTKGPLQLTLTKVHEERLAKVGENLYFACSDFADGSGKVFDLDFFMEEKDEKLVVTEVMIHKEDGKARYSWYEEEGVWKRKEM